MAKAPAGYDIYVNGKKIKAGGEIPAGANSYTISYPTAIPRESLSTLAQKMAYDYELAEENKGRAPDEYVSELYRQVKLTVPLNAATGEALWTQKEIAQEFNWTVNEVIEMYSHGSP